MGVCDKGVGEDRRNGAGTGDDVKGSVSDGAALRE